MLVLYGIAAVVALVVFMSLQRLSKTLRIVFAVAVFFVLSAVATWLFMSGDTASSKAREWTKDDLEKSARTP